jgi:RNA polymerase sigma factor (TIGR02999 family)
VTVLLHQSRLGDRDASEQLMALVYESLHRLAAKRLGAERAGHTLQATALVHEAWMRLAQADIEWRDRVHFYAVAARMMRRILVDYARTQTRAKRGGGAEKLSLDESIMIGPDRFDSLLVINDAIDRLGALDSRRRDIIDLVLFGGLTLDETGAALDVSTATVHRELKLAKAWLQRELTLGKNAASV